jgi:sec-independent protein translocase protein TatB
MFDLSFWEIAVILIVALIVVGPERLPGLARTAGLWMGKARRFVASVKADIDRELKTEELRQLLDKQAQEVAQLREMLDETKSAIDPQHLIGPARDGPDAGPNTALTPPTPAPVMPAGAPMSSPVSSPSQPANEKATP